jgi:hypothetical protein
MYEGCFKTYSVIKLVQLAIWPRILTTKNLINYYMCSQIKQNKVRLNINRSFLTYSVVRNKVKVCNNYRASLAME